MNGTVQDQPRLNCQNKGIYAWVCKNAGCNYAYVGQTARPFCERLCEHATVFIDEEYHGENYEYKSNLRNHLIECHNQRVRKGIFTLKKLKDNFGIMLLHDIQDTSRKRNLTMHEDMYAWCFGTKTMNKKSIAVYRSNYFE